MVLVKIISGIQNSGKTTLASTLEAEYREKGFLTAGFIADAEYTQGRKDTYYYRDLKTGRREMAVSAVKPIDSKGWIRHDFSRFYFSDRAFSFAENLLLEAVSSENKILADYIFIDELGPLELDGGGLFNVVQRIIGCFHGTICLVIRESLVQSLSDKLGLKSESIEIIKAEYQAQ